MQRYIITGGTGLVGSALADSLAEEGHDVLAARNADRLLGWLREQENPAFRACTLPALFRVVDGPEGLEPAL